MKSPFVDSLESNMESYAVTDEIYDEVGSAGPFLNQEEIERPGRRKLVFESEDLVDEEEDEFDLSESETGGLYQTEIEDEYSRGATAYEEESPASILPVEPLAVPEGKPVPFAPPPEPGSYWPVVSSNAKGREVAFQGTDRKYQGNSSRRFLASRTDGDRYHAGIDLYANHRDPIVACEDGTIVNFYHFYRSTYALLVEGRNKVINYGEVEKDSLTGNKLKIGDKVRAGQVIAFVGKMHRSSMLHFETYTIGTRSNKRFKVGGTAPKELLNPTRYLLFLQRDGLQGKGGSPPVAIPGTSDAPGKNWSKAVELNRYYGKKLPWIQHVYLINDLLLKATGQSGISLGEEAFAQAVSAWQLQNGFSQKEADGVIGPNTWKKMQTVLGVKAVPVSEHSGVKAADKSIVSNILKYTAVIEKYSSLYKINSNLVRGIIAAESGGNALSGKGKSGYKGLMQAERTEDQLQPDTSVKTGVDKFIKFRDKTLNPWLAKLGIKLPAQDDENYLKACLACYNAGPVTALKAIQYAHMSGNWRQWLSAEHYLRALVFSGGYDRYVACNANANGADIDKATAERIKYRFKTSGWRSEPDPAPWGAVASVINPITRCWIETKFKNTPGYLDKFIFYFKYFQSNPVARELEGVEYETDRDSLTYGEERFQGEDIHNAMRDEEEVVDEEETAWEEETDFEEPVNERVAYEEEDEEEELEELYDEYESVEDEAVEDFGAEDESSYDYARSEDETSIDNEEWEEDWLEASRSEAEYDSEQSPSDLFYTDSEAVVSDGEVTSPSVFNGWLNSVVNLKKKFADEPQHNLDQLPMPPWVNVEAFYKNFGEKHGGDAKTIMGDVTKKVNARYFVLHDTAVAADFTQARIKGKGIHLWLNAKSPVVLGNDWHAKGLGVKLERRRNSSFVHVEITRDKDLQKAVKQKTKDKKVSAEEFAKEGGVRKFGTYYTDKQYELLAYAYLVASIRRGKFLTVTIHREVDRAVVVKRSNGQYGYGHDDPQFFDIDHFYGIICRMLAIPGNFTFGIQSARVLSNRQSNSAGYVNTFIPFVTGDAEAANQYGELIRLNPNTTKYKVVKLKYGYYYDVTRLKNQFQETEIGEEVSEKDALLFSSEVRPGLSSVPALIAEDSTLPGYTCYVRIDLGKGNYPLNMTGIYVPEVFDPRQPVDAVLYLHGMTGVFPGACAQIIDYWGVSEPPKYDLRIREEINASGRNVVLVVPSLGNSPNKYQNYLSGKKQGLDSYLDKVLLSVNSYIVKRRLNSNPINFRNVVLAAHSAGGMQMLKIVLSDNPIYGPKILECWGFDSLYGNVVDQWGRWATKNRGKKLMIYYQNSTKGNATLLERDSKKLPNVFIQESSAKNHYWVVKQHLKDRIMKIGQSGLTKSNF